VEAEKREQGVGSEAFEETPPASRHLFQSPGRSNEHSTLNPTSGQNAHADDADGAGRKIDLIPWRTGDKTSVAPISSITSERASEHSGMSRVYFRRCHRRRRRQKESVQRFGSGMFTIQFTILLPIMLQTR
jgi:hypothetical protein